MAERRVTIGRIARRVAGFSNAITQGHEFGIAPGPHAQMWTPEYSRAALEIFETAFPWVYLVRMADGFDECDDAMVEMSTVLEHDIEWTRLQQYLRSVSRAIREKAPAANYEKAYASELEDSTPPIMPFRQLAELTSSEAAAEMHRCANEVVQLCGEFVDNPLNALQIEWMRRLGRGEKIIDLARSAGYSERTMYRALNQLWEELGVSNRSEAIALASEKGWMNLTPFAR